MVKKILEVISYNADEIKYITSLGMLTGNMWGKTDDELKKLKERIRSQLSLFQNHECAYCGFKLGITSNDEIEHIAPKGKIGKRVLYPQFMFTEKNLALSCHYCNSILKKGTFDTIETYDEEYEKCTFKIVHPYFDDPSDHLDWLQEGEKILILCKNNSPKGQASINLFELATERHSEERAEKAVIKLLKETLPAGEYEELIKQALEFR
ncbi:HNH endonuclease [Ectobacillus funiculus]|uniref:HNH endonuclease n=1 Tax=Ectobacillus funiculus TaxID=137993 RepID=UPI003978F59C